MNNQWIPYLTPLPFNYTTNNDPILKYSVDPGAHLKCAKQCQTSPSAQICIDICLQQIWTNRKL